MVEKVKFTIEIDSGNDDVVSRPEFAISEILQEIADKVQMGWRCGPIFDANGNRIGQFGFTD